MRQQTKRRRTKKQSWKHRGLATLKNRIWILVGIVTVSIAILLIAGPKIVELDQYLDRQLERAKARR
jgi:hypothetical protein